MKRIIQELFKAFYDDPQMLPPDWSVQAMDTDLIGKSVIICDFLSE